MRSASRFGFGDLGVNRRRLEEMKRPLFVKTLASVLNPGDVLHEVL